MNHGEIVLRRNTGHPNSPHKAQNVTLTLDLQANIFSSSVTSVQLRGKGDFEPAAGRLGYGEEGGISCAAGAEFSLQSATRCSENAKNIISAPQAFFGSRCLFMRTNLVSVS